MNATALSANDEGAPAEPEYLTLEEWAAPRFRTPPSQAVLLRYAREGRFSPPPLKIGKLLYVKASVQFKPPAKLSPQERAKSRTALYRHFDAAGRLLYVGVSLRALSRTLDHVESAPWFHQVTKITIEHFPTRAVALEMERIVIKRERPLHNIVHAKKP